MEPLRDAALNRVHLETLAHVLQMRPAPEGLHEVARSLLVEVGEGAVLVRARPEQALHAFLALLEECGQPAETAVALCHLQCQLEDSRLVQKRLRVESLEGALLDMIVDVREGGPRRSVERVGRF